MRLLIALVLLVLAGCDTGTSPKGQVQADSPTDNAKSAKADVGLESANGMRATLSYASAGQKAPMAVFADAKGGDVTLSDFAGRPVLVNFWATWCAPCIAEMPQLDTLAEAYGKDRLQVLTLSQDTQGAAKVLPFFAQRKFRVLQPWLDPENSFGFHYGTGLLPTSVLYDREGKEVARISGAPDWTGEDAVGLIEDAIN